MACWYLLVRWYLYGPLVLLVTAGTYMVRWYLTLYGLLVLIWSVGAYVACWCLYGLLAFIWVAGTSVDAAE